MTQMQWQTERMQQLDPANAERMMRAMFGLGRYMEQSGLERSLLHLMMMRASQINGCANCLDMHTKDARARGESEQRLYLLNAWRESPFYNARERAALAWTEAVTLLAAEHVPDAVYEEVRQSFNDDELVNLTMAVAAINSYNRLNVALRTVPGDYQPGAVARLFAGAEQREAVGA
jgi:AhpD family alkylhydroperoxidase